MIHLYPSNRLESLVILLDRVFHHTRQNPLRKRTLMVQNAGMRHWLNLELAELTGISMNLDFYQPTSFFWKTIPLLLGEENIPKESLFSREILTWRLFRMLGDETTRSDPLCQIPTRYCFGEETNPLPDELKRFQLASQLADLYEQYLIYRPDWILNWETGVSNRNPKDWQAILWQRLTKENPHHILNLMSTAKDSLERNSHLLPEHVFIFGLNSLPPHWIGFLSELGKHIHLHIFHLNPCIAYWGDLQSEKEKSRYLNRQIQLWTQPQVDDLHDTTQSIHVITKNKSPGNPLLANMGGQGREFLALLQEQCPLEIPVFHNPSSDVQVTSVSTNKTLLHRVQEDILHLRDSRSKPEEVLDSSIHITSSHGALREVQTLHDWILHQMKADTTLNLKDIMILCPQVEDYAPYVQAVFALPGEAWNAKMPSIPCTIADRALILDEPLLGIFMELVGMLSSRFEVNTVMELIRFPAVKLKFNFEPGDVSLLMRWLKHSGIHWGLDAQHKAQILEMDQSNNAFTWDQGLNRLLLGFAYGDEESLYHNQLLLPEVEEEQTLLLGKLCHFISQLKTLVDKMKQHRTPEKWKDFWIQNLPNLLSSREEDKDARRIIEKVFQDLVTHTQAAECSNPISIDVLKDHLTQHLQKSAPGKQFLTGKVTLCSMVPMRSIPFKLIAILGLNDGEFPRQRLPFGFDLMAQEKPRRGDRSRRGDDRYLFLEALISARQALFLSYQGKHIRTNEAREPSLVLSELMHYLEDAYMWSPENIQKTPLHPFSSQNYDTAKPSFDSRWLRLAQPGQERQNRITLSPYNPTEKVISIESLVRFYDSPLKAFAAERLGLYFENLKNNTLSDEEPFVASSLDKYTFQDQWIEAKIAHKNTDELFELTLRRGALPFTPKTPLDLEAWAEEAETFARNLPIDSSTEIVEEYIQMTIAGFTLKTAVKRIGTDWIWWRPAKVKGKDDIRLWLHHLLAACVSGQESDPPIQVRAFQKGTSKSKTKPNIVCNTFYPIENPQEHLENWVEYWLKGMQTPMLLHTEIGRHFSTLTPSLLQEIWNGDPIRRPGLIADPCNRFFFPETTPHLTQEDLEHLRALYEPLYQAHQEFKL